MAHAIVHFEIPSDNIEHAKKFYKSLFGWKMKKMPRSMEYWTFSNTSDKNNNT
jgi:predicted enzyme related to lactoylglutathione lyase